MALCGYRYWLLLKTFAYSPSVVVPGAVPVVGGAVVPALEVVTEVVVVTVNIGKQQNYNNSETVLTAN